MSTAHPEPSPLVERELRDRIAAVGRELRAVEDDLRVIRDPWHRRNLGRRRRELKDARAVLLAARSPQP